MKDRGGAYRVLVVIPERTRPLGRPRQRWEDNIKMAIQEVGCGGNEWIELAQDRDRWCECSYEHLGSIKCGEFLD